MYISALQKSKVMAQCTYCTQRTYLVNSHNGRPTCYTCAGEPLRCNTHLDAKQPETYFATSLKRTANPSDTVRTAYRKELNESKNKKNT